MSKLAEIYKATIDKLHAMMAPVSAATPDDPDGVAGRIGVSDAKKEAAKALKDADGVAVNDTATATSK